ncbi:hypothetical protein GQ53DRAFT_141084 [Thozetella sp. PMI_491]|nr:hypothetical protein GQ53DRAFT_141084 [Thozetella sp. PMI_491]
MAACGEVEFFLAPTTRTESHRTSISQFPRSLPPPALHGTGREGNPITDPRSPRKPEVPRAFAGLGILPSADQHAKRPAARQEAKATEEEERAPGTGPPSDGAPIATVLDKGLAKHVLLCSGDSPRDAACCRLLYYPSEMIALSKENIVFPTDCYLPLRSSVRCSVCRGRSPARSNAVRAPCSRPLDRARKALDTRLAIA